MTEQGTLFVDPPTPKVRVIAECHLCDTRFDCGEVGSRSWWYDPDSHGGVAWAVVALKDHEKVCTARTGEPVPSVNACGPTNPLTDAPPPPTQGGASARPMPALDLP